MSFKFRGLLPAALLLAQVTAVAAESCLPTGQPAPLALLTAFRDNPRKTLLEDTPVNLLAATINSIVSADTTLAAQVVALLPGLAPDRSRAIGSGLGQAANACRSNYPGDRSRIEAATSIQQALAATDSRLALGAYDVAAQNVQTGAVGGGGAGGGGLGSASNGAVPTGGTNSGGSATPSAATSTAPSVLASGAGISSIGTLPVSSR